MLGVGVCACANHVLTIGQREGLSKPSLASYVYAHAPSPRTASSRSSWPLHALIARSCAPSTVCSASPGCPQSPAGRGACGQASLLSMQAAMRMHTAMHAVSLPACHVLVTPECAHAARPHALPMDGHQSRAHASMPLCSSCAITTRPRPRRAPPGGAWASWALPV